MKTAVLLVAILFGLAAILAIRDRAKHVKAPLVYIVTAALASSLILYVAQRDHDTKQTNQRRDESTADARYGACVGFNQEQQGDRDAQLNGILVVAGRAEPGNLTADDREQIVAGFTAEEQDRFRKYEQQAAFDNPFRDCSPSGIAAYYEQPPADPAAD